LYSFAALKKYEDQEKQSTRFVHFFPLLARHTKDRHFFGPLTGKGTGQPKASTAKKTTPTSSLESEIKPASTSAPDPQQRMLHSAELLTPVPPSTSPAASSQERKGNLVKMRCVSRQRKLVFALFYNSVAFVFFLFSLPNS
jgi:hypothetical protein